MLKLKLLVRNCCSDSTTSSQLSAVRVCGVVVDVVDVGVVDVVVVDVVDVGVVDVGVVDVVDVGVVIWFLLSILLRCRALCGSNHAAVLLLLLLLLFLLLLLVANYGNNHWNVWFRNY